MRERAFFLTCLIAVLVLALLGCSVGLGSEARVTATATKTPHPLFTATHTPTLTPPPTNTPLPTNTPAPTDTPMPTNTPVVVTATPSPTDALLLPTATHTPVPPTDTPAPTQPPKPAATKTPVPATATPTPKPALDFKVKEIVAFPDPDLSQSAFHNVYFTVLDANDAPIDGIIFEEVNNPPPVQVVSGSKGPGKAEFTMSAGDYKFKIVGNSGGQTFSSETTHVLSVVFGHAVYDDLIRGGICANEAACQALGPSHYSYSVTFQRTR